MGERLALIAVCILWIGGIATLGYFVLLKDDGGSGESEAQEPRGGLAPATDVRGCAERLTGTRPDADPQRDTVLGPVTFLEAPGTYGTSYRGRAYVTPDFLPGLNAHPMDVLALVQAGEEARIVVPRAQRRWMRLFYSEAGETGQSAITLEACGRSTTAFEGGIYVDFDRAPQGGRCAELEVQVPSETTTYRGQVFGPSPGRCRGVAVGISPRQGRPITVFEVSFRSGARLGVSRDTRRSYRAAVKGPAGEGCVRESEAFTDRGRPRNRITLSLSPGRTKGVRWCPGRYQGTLSRVNGYACPARGPCQPPRGFPRREQTVGRFAFRVR